MSNPGSIEVSIDVKISAGIAFWVDRQEWAAMSDVDKRAIIDERITGVAIAVDNDVMQFRSATLTATITGPGLSEIDLKSIQIYDPEE